MNAPSFGPPPSYGQNQQSQYDFWVRQAPEKARVVVRGKERDRKPIDPPPVLQLNHRTEPIFLHNPYLFCKCWLWHETEHRPVTNEEVGDTRSKDSDVLLGQTTSSLHRLKDLDNTERGFFVFGDLSVATIGKFRLRFCLWEYNVQYNTATFLSECITRDPFEVSSHKEWDGIRESTVLSRTIADQGIKLRLRKESRHPRGRALGGASASTTGTSSTTPIRPNPTPSGSYGSVEGHEDIEPHTKRQRSAGDSSSGGPSSTMGTPHTGSMFSTGVPGSSYSSYPGTGQAAIPPQYYNMSAPYSNTYNYSLPSGYGMAGPAPSYPAQRTGAAQGPYGSPSYPAHNLPRYPTSYGSGAGAGSGQYLQNPAGAQSYGSPTAGQPRVYAGQTADYGARPGQTPSYSSSYGTSLPSLTANTPMANPGSTPHLAPISTNESAAGNQASGHSSYGGSYGYQAQGHS